MLYCYAKCDLQTGSFNNISLSLKNADSQTPARPIESHRYGLVQSQSEPCQGERTWGYSWNHESKGAVGIVCGISMSWGFDFCKMWTHFWIISIYIYIYIYMAIVLDQNKYLMLLSLLRHVMGRSISIWRPMEFFFLVKSNIHGWKDREKADTFQPYTYC